jgi:type 1 glutamine amidotransferase
MCLSDDASDILEITGWKLCRDTGYYDWVCSVIFFRPFGQVPVYYLKLGHDHDLSHIPQFIIL